MYNPVSTSVSTDGNTITSVFSRTAGDSIYTKSMVLNTVTPSVNWTSNTSNSLSVLGSISELSDTATEADLVAGNYLALNGAEGTKKLPAEVVAKAGDVDGFFLEKNIEQKELGYLNADGTISASTIRGVTDYIDINGFYKLSVISGVASIADAQNTYACFYDEDKAFVSALKWASAVDDVVTDINVPESAKFIRFTLSSAYKNADVKFIGGENIRVLAKRIDYLKKWTSVERVENIYELGYLNADGTISASTIRGVTGFILLDGVIQMYLLSGIASISNSQNTYACFYDADKVFVSALKWTSAVEDVVAEIDVPLRAKYVRFTISSLSSPAIFEIVGEKNVAKISTDLHSFLSSFSVYGVSQRSESYENGILNSDGTIAASTTRGVTDYIDVDSVEKIKTLYGVASTWASSLTYACFYDADKAFVSALKWTSAIDDVVTEIDVPLRVKYVRFQIFSNTAKVAYGLKSFGGFFEKIENPEIYKNRKNFGKRFALFGGSLTYNFVRTYGVHELWLDSLGINDFKFYGVGGAGFSNAQSNNIQNQVSGASANSDVFVLWCSGNDYYGQYDVGTASDYTTDDNYDSSKRATQCGGMNYCIKTIYEKNPNAAIVIFTSLPIFQSRNGWVKSSVSGTKTLYDYVQAQKDVAARWGIPCFDQFVNCGFGEINYTQYFMEDKGHITDVGYNAIVGKQIDFLANA